MDGLDGTMAHFDMVTVDVLSASFQTQQLGEGMLSYQLAQDGRLVAPCGASIAVHPRSAPSSGLWATAARHERRSPA
jgi:hypothetical protein